MRVHVDNIKFKSKPTGLEIGGIKARFTKAESIRNLTIEQIAEALVAGRTIQPGVTPFSEESKAIERKGTVKEDFIEQSVFMIDIDNKRTDVPQETPAHVAKVLADHGLKAAFMYETFSSMPECLRFRFALVCNSPLTDRAERDRVQAALITLFPQADNDCVNADRIFFGTDKGLIDSFTNFDAVCDRAALLALAKASVCTGAAMHPGKSSHGEVARPTSKWTKYGETIPTGERHGTLVSFAAAVLKRYGETDRAYEAFIQRAAQCEEPKPSDEVDKIWRDACAFYNRSIASDPNYQPPEEYALRELMELDNNAPDEDGLGDAGIDYTREQPLICLEPSDYTDVGEARVFIEQYGELARYSAATKWLIYDGRKWNESELKAQGLAQELTDKQLEEAKQRIRLAQEAEDEAMEAGDADKAEAAKNAMAAAKKFRTFVLERRKTSRIAATLTEARPPLEIAVDDLDRDPFMLNTPGGTVDLRTGIMKAHDPTDYCTKMTAVTPSTEGMEIWEEFLDRITCGDEALKDYHQICSGMELIGKVFCENLIIAHGTGGNGKSTFYNSKFLVLGDYAGSLSAETLTVNCRKNKSPEYAELRGKRFVIAAELEEGMRLDTAVVKKLCSTDPIKAEKKYRDPFEFMPSHTTILYTNHLPKVGTNDKGTWDRLVVVPFLANLRGVKGEIKNYADYLLHACGGAILLWMIQGAKQFIDANFIIEQPKIVKDALETYRQENDWLGNFISECCETEDGSAVGAGDLYNAYRTHCANLNEYTRHVSDFKSALVGAGFRWHRDKNGAHYFGLKLKQTPLVVG